MTRLSSDEKRINQKCKAAGLDPQHVLRISRSCLEQARDGFDAQVKKANIMTRDQIEKDMNAKRRKFLRIMKNVPEDNKQFDKYETIITEIHNTPWIAEVIAVVLAEVTAYRNSGGEYKLILEKCYFSDETLSKKDLADLLYRSDSYVTSKKREAIKLFGFLLYDYAERRESEEKVKQARN